MSRSNNILIHIGFHKTASTWLQKNIIKGNSAFIPLEKGSKAKNFGNSLVKDNLNKVRSPFDTDLSYLRSYFINFDPGEKIVAISNERLSGYPDSGGFDQKNIADRIKSIFPEAKILITIREQKDLILSCYSEYLKKGGILNLKDYISMPYDNKIPNVSYDYFDFFPLVNYYYNIFSKEDVLVLPYEDLIQNPEIFFKELSDFLDESIYYKKFLKHKLNKKAENLLMYKFPKINAFFKGSSLNSYFFKKYGKNSNPFQLTDKVLSKIWLYNNLREAHFKEMRIFIDNFISNYYVYSNKKLAECIDKDLKKFNYF